MTRTLPRQRWNRRRSPACSLDRRADDVVGQGREILLGNRYQATLPVFEWLGAGEKLGIYYRQEGGHKQGEEDWQALLDFADLVFFGKKPKSGETFKKLLFPDEKLRFSWKAPPKPTGREDTK